MGGWRSGRYRTKNTVPIEAELKISIDQLNKQGIFQGNLLSMSWRYKGAPHSCTVEYLSGTEQIMFTIDGESHAIDLDYYQSGYGGRTPLFLHGGRRVRHIYYIHEWRRLVTRHQFNARSSTWSMSTPDRAREKAIKLRKRFGLSVEYPFIYDPIYPFQKPKGMHWKTFYRIKNEIEAAWVVYWGPTIRFLENTGIRVSQKESCSVGDSLLDCLP